MLMRGKMDDKKLKKLVQSLAGDGALAWAWKKDESLVVINGRGEKRRFSPEECIEAMRKLAGKPQKGGKAHDKIG